MKKIKLKNLNVTSFVTSDELNSARGGVSRDCSFYTNLSECCSGYCNPTEGGTDCSYIPAACPAE